MSPLTKPILMPGGVEETSCPLATDVHALDAKLRNLTSRVDTLSDDITTLRNEVKTLAELLKGTSIRLDNQVILFGEQLQRFTSVTDKLSKLLNHPPTKARRRARGT